MDQRTLRSFVRRLVGGRWLRVWPAFWLVLPCPLLAPSEGRSQEVPPAEEIIAAFVDAIGGRDAHTTPASIRRTGTIELPAMGLQGLFEIVQVQPDRTLNRVEIPGIGEMLAGYDGEVGWRVDPILGPTLLEGAELEQLRERANVLSIVRDASVVSEMTTVELTEYDDEPCWSVRIIWASGRQSRECYSVETGLLVASEETQVSQMGELPVTVRFSEYSIFEGMVLPTRLVQTSMGQTQVMRIETVEVGDVEATDLEPPPAIRTLLEGIEGQ